MDANYVPAAQESLRWDEVLSEALLHPSVETFRRIIEDPKASLARIYFWTLGLTVVIAIVTWLTLPVMEGLGAIGPAVIAIYMLGIVVIGPIFSILGLVISAWIYKLVASLFGGSGTTMSLAYGLGVVSVLTMLFSLPVSIITSMLTSGNQASPLVFCTVPFSLALSVYAIFLQVRAVQAGLNLTAGKAFLTIILPGILFFVLGMACVFLSLIPLIQQSGGFQ